MAWTRRLATTTPEVAHLEDKLTFRDVIAITLGKAQPTSLCFYEEIQEIGTGGFRLYVTDDGRVKLLLTSETIGDCDTAAILSKPANTVSLTEEQNTS